jgi:hypothetical protein
MWFIEDKPEMGTLCKIFLTLDDPGACILSQILSALVMCLILVSISCLILASVEDFQETPSLCDELLAANKPITVEACTPLQLPIFDEIEVWVIALFTLEYLPRVLLVHQVTYKQAGLKKPCSNGFLQTWRYATKPMNCIDFLSIAPFYLELMDLNMGGGLAVLRVLRLMRVIRIIKVGRFNKGMNMLQEVWYRTKPAAGLLLFFNLIFVVVFAALIYVVENVDFEFGPDITGYGCVTKPTGEPYCHYHTHSIDAHRTGTYLRPTVDGYDKEASPFDSIPLSVWWVLTTMTTVGYGDFYPTTKMGKVIGILCFYVGLISLAMPISILSMNFEAVYLETYPHLQGEAAEHAKSSKKKKKRILPYAQKPWLPNESDLRKLVFFIFEDAEVIFFLPFKRRKF